MKIFFLSLLFLSCTISGLLLLFGIATPLLTNQAYNKTALSKYGQDQIESQIKNLRAYLNGQEALNQSFYTNREVLNLFDIKKLITLLKNLFAWMTVVLGLVVSHHYHTKNLPGLIKLAGFSARGAALLCLALAILLVFFFDSFFIFFHQTIFSNDYWLLDPGKESLIILFPPEVFYRLIRQVLITTLLLMTTLGGITFLAKPFSKKLS